MLQVENCKVYFRTYEQAKTVALQHKAFVIYNPKGELMLRLG